MFTFGGVEAPDEASCHAVLMYIYEVRPRKDGRRADLISDALPFAIYGMRARLRSRTQSDMRRIAADHMVL